MANFTIDTEIDKLIDKTMLQFRGKLKKLITKGQKLVLKQYIASQKETTRVTQGALSRKSITKTKGKAKGKSSSQRSRIPRRERDYAYYDSSSSNEEC